MKISEKHPYRRRRRFVNHTNLEVGEEKTDLGKLYGERKFSDQKC